MVQLMSVHRGPDPFSAHRPRCYFPLPFLGAEINTRSSRRTGAVSTIVRIGAIRQLE